MNIDDSGYADGRLDMALTMANGPIEAACSAANYVFNAANTKGSLRGGDLIAVRQLRVRLLRAAGTLSEVIERNRPTLQAAE